MPLTKREKRKLINEAIAINEDERYGKLSHPVSLGILLAISIAQGDLNNVGSSANQPRKPRKSNDPWAHK